jgi:enamine deaminase RidA (YjgF/YER057c/UK114 family)
MKYKNKEYKDFSVRVSLSIFDGGRSAREFHAFLTTTDTHLDAQSQYRNLAAACAALSSEPELAKAAPVFCRYFVSDAVNQSFLQKQTAIDGCAVSVVQQPPLDGAKVALWIYYSEQRNQQYRHYFDAQLHDGDLDPARQTTNIFGDYSDRLSQRGLTLADNCIRTWIYVSDVDNRYSAMVDARKQFFTLNGLTADTHYIASTGIEGKYINPKNTILMDAYAVGGLQPEQITYIKGSSHLNPTNHYGVTFERATAVDYGDRRHIFVSGTASIDNRGQIVAPFDIEQQTERTLENISVLLAEVDATASDLAQMTVYLRDTADYARVAEYLQQCCPDVPKVIVWAPVCRPGWLIEIECIAVKGVENRGVGNF